MSAPAGPYTVEHRRFCDDCNGDGGVLDWEDGRVVGSEACARCDEGRIVVSRWAYATLEEVHRAVVPMLDKGGVANAPAVAYRTLPESGGTIKLPDGSEIVVEATNWPKLASQVDDGAYLPETRIVAAWNAEYGIGEGA